MSGFNFNLLGETTPKLSLTSGQKGCYAVGSDCYWKSGNKKSN